MLLFKLFKERLLPKKCKANNFRTNATRRKRSQHNSLKFNSQIATYGLGFKVQYTLTGKLKDILHGPDHLLNGNLRMFS